ncbi:PAS domain S-box protein [Rubellimicrobium arenae]|nr:PAS domain S-box protein [Rubellimicrobium arenae]
MVLGTTGLLVLGLLTPGIPLWLPLIGSVAVAVALAVGTARRSAELIRLRATVDALPDGIAIFDPADRIAFYNARYPEHLAPALKAALRPGLRFDEWLRAGLQNGPIYHPDMGEDFAARRLAIRAQGPSDHVHRLIDGRWVRIRESRLRDGGRVLQTTHISDERRRAAEHALLAAALEEIAEPVEITDADRRFTYVNRAFEAVTGIPAAEAIGRTAREILSSGEHDAAFFEAIDACLARGEVWRGIIVNRARNGRRLEQDTTITPLRDDGGHLAHFVSVRRDVGAARAEARALAASEARYRAVVETQTEYIIRVDDDGYWTFMNAAAQRRIGKSLDEIRALGQRDQDFVHPEDRPVYDAHMARLTPLNPTDTVEFRTIYDGNRVHWEQWTDTGIFDDQGRLIEIQCVGHDVSDRRRAEAELRASEERLAAIIEANPLAMNIARLSDRRLLFVNQPWRDLFGVSAADPNEADLARLYADPGDRDRIFAAMASGEEVTNRELRFRRVDGTEITCSITSRPILFQGEPALVTSTIDLTQLRAAEAEIARQREALHQSEKMTALGALLAGVAHELNNPLSVVVGYSSMLRETVSDPDLLERLGKVHGAADRCARIVRTFLAMARAKPPVRGPVDVGELVLGALDLSAYALRTAGVEVRTDLPARLPPVWGDADQLGQVVTNLVVNAQQALLGQPAPRRMLLAARAEGDQVLLEVSDNGPGMAPEVAKRAFDPFFTTKPQGVGTGVGLSVCHGIVAAHGGRIDLETAPGQGARLRVWLPRGETGLSDLAAPDDHEPLSGGRVLVVDDEPDVASLVAEALGIAGYEVDTAPSGRRALAALRARRFDAVVTDLRMPDMDGSTLVDAIRREHPHLARRIVIVTGDALTLSGHDPAADVPTFEKPLDLRGLLATVRRMMEDS